MPEQTTLTVKFGDAIMQGGFTSVPNLVMKLYAELGITSTEMMLIQHIWLFWYEKQEDMFPALPTIAERMGLSRRQLQAYVSSLKEKRYLDPETGYKSQPYLQIRERYAQSGGQLSNQYDFSGLLEAVIYLARKKRLITDSAPEAEPTTPQKKTTRGWMQKTARAPQQKTSTEEDEVEEDEFQKDEDSSKKALKAEVMQKSAYSHGEHMATGKTEEATEKASPPSSRKSGSTSHTNPSPHTSRAETSKNEHPRFGEIDRRPLQSYKKTHEARTPAYIGKPITQDEIDTRKREGKNASGLTPLSGIIPASHWQELERSAGKAPQGYSTHYNNCTKNAPVFINALVEQFSLLLGDDPENTPQNINRAAKLYRQAEMSEEDFRAVLHEALDQAQHYHSSKIKKQRADRRPNRMPVFFTILEERIGQKTLKKLIN